MGIIASLLSTLLLINNLLLCSNFLLVKENTVLHILAKVKETQVKVLGEEPKMLDGLVEPLFMLLHNLLLVYESFILKFLVGLSLPSSPKLELLQPRLRLLKLGI